MVYIGSEPGMNIVLFSDDEALASFCREVLIETFGATSKLEVARAGKRVSADDVCLWDFIPGQSVVPQTVDPANWGHWLFLADCKHLTDLEQLVGTSDIHVLLKPVAPAALRAFLAHQHRIHKDYG